MQIILLKDVLNLGKKWEIKNVAEGYARNFLLLKGLAELATSKKISQLKQNQQKFSRASRLKEEQAGSLLQQLAGKKVTLAALSSPKGTLFKAVAFAEIAKAAAEQLKIKLEPSWLKLERPLKELGQHLLPLNHLTEKFLTIEIIKKDEAKK